MKTLLIALSIIILTGCNAHKNSVDDIELAKSVHVSVEKIQSLSDTDKASLKRLSNVNKEINAAFQKEFCGDMGKGIYENTVLVDANNKNACK